MGTDDSSNQNEAGNSSPDKEEQANDSTSEGAPASRVRKLTTRLTAGLKGGMGRVSTIANEVIIPFAKQAGQKLGPKIGQKLSLLKSPRALTEASKNRFQQLREKIKKELNGPAIRERIENFDPQKFVDWLHTTVQNRGAAFYGTLITIVLSTYFISDVTALIIGDIIPEPTFRTRSSLSSFSSRTNNQPDYQIIFTRNLFNSQGLIPGDGVSTPGTEGESDLGGAPVKTSLPLNLIGTLVLTNPALSIATVEDKGSGIVYPLRMDDEIPDKLRVLSVEPTRMVFINRSNSRREYIDLPEEAGQNPRIVPGQPARQAGSGIERVSPNQFNIDRSEVDHALADFNSILTQARAVPASDNGMPGFRLFQIVPGSIYDKLGIQNGDFISGINGEPITDPTKAFQMLSGLKTANHLELQIKRDGKQMNYNYDIH